MNYSLRLVTPPDDDVVTLEEAKAHLRVDTSDDDAVIQAMVTAATEFVDGAQGFLGRALMLQTWDYFLDRFPCYGTSSIVHLGTGAVPYGVGGFGSYIEIPLPPLVSVTGVYYRDNSGNEQTVNPANYKVDVNSEPGKIFLPNGGAWPTIVYGPSAVRIRFVAGNDDSDNIPRSIKNAILLYVADLFENRGSIVLGETTSKISWGAEQLLRRHRFYLGTV